MNHATVNGTTLAYDVSGEGEPVVLLHPGFVADAMKPLMREPALSGYKLINYHRRGYGQSARSGGVIPIQQQAQDCIALMDALGIDEAHLVAHSIGANIALQVALAAPERVRSLTLLEPPLLFAVSPESQAIFGSVVGAAFAKYGAGDYGGAADAWLSVPFGPDYQAIMESALPGSTKQLASDATAVFESEAPALQTWSVVPDDLKRITQPALFVFHVDSNIGFFQEVHETLVNLLPQYETLVVPNATHLLQIQQPRIVAEGLSSFLQRHPIAVRA